ncbi:carboxypeptidase regulatory-like domain-containing protein [Archangium sp.]|uniref:carboxypeptidase regulatory-like domain-containing protein n=1 Tax=Archangium sp. TaxID=1872627 RepID=UPI002D553673|nr:carboxypeptidase regulatory-like domain-containing protein [Archangium sp.]HYO58844.1 carboxypeptidase regulatory-like domain-containing protein [Archangium sp.]
MRKRTLVAVALGLGLGLLLLLRSWQAERSVASSLSGATTARAPGSPQPGRPGAVDPPERPVDPLVPGTPEVESSGFLEVEVLAGEQPVPGASVRLYERGARDPNLGEVVWRQGASGSTDARGRVRLPSGPGNYLVAARAPGKAPRLRDVVRPSGEALTHLRLTLEAGQGLIGRTVVHGTGEPLPLVELTFIPHGRKLEDWEVAEAPAEERVYATSDARGAFRVEGLASGWWALWARAPGHGPVYLNDVRVPASEPLEIALSRAGVIEGFVVDAEGRPAPGAEVLVSGGYHPVVVTTGAGGGFSAEVEAGPHRVSARRGDEAGALETPVVVAAGRTVRDVRVRLGAGARFEGRVVARRSGAPVEGATVHVSPFGDNGDSGRAVTDAQGHYAVGGLAPGAYDVAVTARGFSELLQRGLTVAPGERFLLDAKLVGHGVVEGTARDAAGRPLAGVRVVEGDRWMPEDLGTPPPEARTNAEGFYRLEGLGTGQVRLSAHREGMAGGVVRYVHVEEGGTARADFTFEETGILEGVVRVNSGPPPARPIQVHALPRRGSTLDPGDTGSTDVESSGFFRLVLPPGSYEVIADHPEDDGPRQRQPELVQVESGKTSRLELALEEPEYPRGLMHGRVLEPDGSPSPAALVTGRGPSEEDPLYFFVSTDAEGRFEYAAPSDIPLRIHAANGGRLGLVEGARTGQEVVVRLQPAGTLRGRVVRPQGAPVRGFVLGLNPLEASESLWTGHERRFAGERFEVKDLPGVPLMLEVRTEDGARGGTLVRLAPGTSTEVELVVRDTARVRGRVVDLEARAPVPGVTVFVPGAPSSSHATTDAEGRFLLEGIPEGEHTLVLGVDGDVEQRTLEVKTGQELDLGDMPLGKPRVPPG